MNWLKSYLKIIHWKMHVKIDEMNACENGSFSCIHTGGKFGFGIKVFQAWDTGCWCEILSLTDPSSPLFPQGTLRSVQPVLWFLLYSRLQALIRSYIKGTELIKNHHLWLTTRCHGSSPQQEVSDYIVFLNWAWMQYLGGPRKEEFCCVLVLKSYHSLADLQSN